MKICVLNGSPKGEYSVTLHTAMYLEKLDSHHQWTRINVGAKIKVLEKGFTTERKMIEESDLIIFCYPVYTFMAPWQLHRFIELLKESDIDLKGKFVTQITTSKHFYDITAHRYVEDNCFDLGLKVIKGLSADMEDLITPKGQQQAKDFWKFLCYQMENDLYEHRPLKQDRDTFTYNNSYDFVQKKAGKKAVIVTNKEKLDDNLGKMIQDFQNIFPYETEVINIKEFPFRGGCLSCFHCATKGKCIYKDGFSELLRDKIQKADSIIYAFTIKDHSMGASFKIYDDRQFCNGHRTVTIGMPIGYLVRGDYENEKNLQMLLEARADVGQNFLAGVATDAKGVKDMSQKISYALENHFVPPQTFYGVGGMKIFRDLIYIMGGMMKADYAFYKAEGFFDDMPHKQKKRILLMKLVGSILSNQKLVSKMGNKMNEGMVEPYRKALKDIDQKSDHQ